MMAAFVRRVSTACVMLLMPLGALGYAQETTGTILGSLVDQTGAVLPGVKVVITSADTGQDREVVTNGLGQYSVSLPVGNYEISYFLPKFQPFTARGISLHVNDRLQVNGKLVVGAIETLTVTSERLVQPTSAVQHLIQPASLQELPLLNRTFVQLATLVPGVASDLREDACFCDQGNLDISINGARRSAVNWLLDGASNVNGWNNYTLVTTPSLEAIQEINVITSSYSAEWARNGGGVVNAVTKSGTSRFSGSAYFFLRNDALNANSFFRNMDPSAEVNSEPSRLRDNDFGYTLGGPAFPSRKKLFFFVSQEWRRRTRDKWRAEASVPDPSWLTDPSSENYVPLDARDPTAVKLLTLWPTPNVPGTNRVEKAMTNALNTRQEFLRADYHVDAKWSLAARNLHERADSRGEYATFPALVPGHRYRIGYVTVAETRRSGARFLHEMTYQSSRYRLARGDRPHTRSELGIHIPELFPENAADAVPIVAISELTLVNAEQPRLREYSTHTVGSALTLMFGPHMVKTGGLFGSERVNSNLIPESTQGLFWFPPGGGFTAFQNFVRGNLGGACDGCVYSETDIDVSNHFRFRRYEWFVQDTWRAHPRITVDVGLRYAFYSPLTDARNMLFTFSPDAYDAARSTAFADPGGVFVALGTGDLFNGVRVAGKDSPYGRALYPADTNNLQPRVGAAWDPEGTGRLFLRAGYGMYFDQSQVEMFAEAMEYSSLDPFRTDLFVSNVLLSNPGTGPTVPRVWPKPRELLFQQSITPSTVTTPQIVTTSDALVAPRWQHWNAGVQRRLYRRGVVDLGYVGSRGDHLIRYVDLNRPQPADLAPASSPSNLVRPFRGYSQIVMRESTAKSRYHALTASFRHDGGDSGSATVNYTLGRNKTNATYDNSSLDDPQNALDKDADFAAALTDRTHILTAFYTYEFPLFRRSSSPWLKALLDGWQVAGITRIESGPAARVQTFSCNYGFQCLGPLRPNQVSAPAAGDQSGLLWFDPAAFVPPSGGEYGDAPVAPFRLPGRHQWDIAVSKFVMLPGSRRLQFRADLINAFNHTQFLDVDTFCFGREACDPGGFGRVVSTRPPREIQLGVKFAW